MVGPALFFTVTVFGGFMMRGMPKRKPMSKGSGAHKFRRDVGKTHPFNMRMAPMRGGWRL